jgi:hypothetical protein
MRFSHSNGTFRDKARLPRYALIEREPGVVFERPGHEARCSAPFMVDLVDWARICQQNMWSAVQ